MTPPEFKYKSGRIIIPFLDKYLSASYVIGPFAPSAIILAFILYIFASFITSSKAAGTKMSHSS